MTSAALYCQHDGAKRRTSHRHIRLALRAVARNVLPRGPGAAPRARVRVAVPELDRDQRLVLLAPAPVELPGVARPDPGRLRLLAEGRALHHAHEAAEGRRDRDGEFLRVRGFGAEG